MKILEISGCNLASLKGEFRIALDQAPFTPDGLFSIGGPTGSGKSTLIDALCLALFDDTPRFRVGGNARVGTADLPLDERLTAKDCRTILHRGAGEAWAQVKFLGVDGHRWRSKWSVNRSRGAASGRMQNQSMELENLDTGERVTGKRTEVVEAIGKKVGLSFDQFRRSVLLAQGDFAAFTRADAKERSGLLEAMTGTEIFGNLSMAAYARRQSEEVALTDLGRRRETLRVLPEARREEVELRIRALDGLIGSGEKRLAGLVRDLAWYATRRALTDRRDEAGRARDGAERAFREAGARRDRLRDVDRAQPLRQVRTGAIQAGRALEDQDRRIRKEQEGLPAAREAVASALAGRATRQDALDQARRAVQEARPLLAAARDLDTRLRASSETLGAETERAAGIAMAVAAARDAAEATGRARSGAASRLKALAEGLERSLADQPLVDAWAGVQPAIRQYGEASAARKVAAEALKERQGRIDGKESRRRADQDRLDGLVRERAELVARLDALKAGLPPASGADLEAARKAAFGRREHLQEAAGLLARLQRTLADLARAEAKAATQDERRARARDQAQEAADQLPLVAARLAEVREALKLSEAALSLEEQRARLVEGAPCPLCGAQDHPWAKGSPVAGLAGQQEARVKVLEQEVSAWERQSARAALELAEAGKALDEAAGEAGRHREAIGVERAAWTDLRARVEDLPGDPAAAAAADATQALRDALEGVLADLDARIAARLRAEEEIQSLQADIDRRSQACRDLEGELQSLAEGLGELRVEAAALEAGFRGHDLAAATQARNLEQVLLPASLELLRRDPAEALADLTERVETRRRDLAKRTELESRLADLATQLEGERKTLEDRQTDLRASEDLKQGLQRNLEDLRQQRAGFFQGRPATEVEKGLDGAEQLAGQALALAGADLQAREVALGGLEAGLKLLQDQRVGLGEAKEQAEAALEAALAAWGGDRASLDGLLAMTPEAIDGERRALDLLDRGRSVAEAGWNEKQAALDAHGAAGVPELAEEALEAAGLDLKAELDQLKGDLGARKLELGQDDVDRQTAAGLDATLAEVERRVSVWRTLDDLIGSREGTRFRNFAQSQTLRTLLAHANVHLKELNPRYLLQRVPGLELEIQVVDRDMGDEVRALSSLSGGETFMVSLALALGLSSLAASSTRIESLFIDEGFGTLDAEAMDLALAMLDGLQAGGRQVGIISHVEGLGAHGLVQVRVEKCGGGRSRVVIGQASREAATVK